WPSRFTGYVATRPGKLPGGIRYGCGLSGLEVSMPSATRNTPRDRAGRNRAAASMVRWLRVVSLHISILTLTGCSEANRYVAPPPRTLAARRPARRPLTHYVEATGTAQPVISVDIRARVRGFLKEQHFREGSAVKKGQLLLVIDEEPFRLALDQARLRLAEAE